MSALATENEIKKRNRIPFAENVERVHDPKRKEERALWNWINNLIRRNPDKYGQLKNKFLEKYGKDFHEVWNTKTPQPKTYRKQKPKLLIKLEKLEEERKTAVRAWLKKWEKNGELVSPLTPEEMEERNKDRVLHRELTGNLIKLFKENINAVTKLGLKNKRRIIERKTAEKVNQEKAVLIT